MNRIWRVLFFITWLVIIAMLVYLTVFLDRGSVNNYSVGKSAYDLAREHGYIGNESQWIESLRGKDGVNGQDGIDSVSTVTKETNTVVKEVPVQGKSAYEVWLEQGNTGTKEDYIESLKGKDGKTVTTMIRLNEITGLLESKLSSDKFWKTIPTCGVKVAC